MVNTDRIDEILEAAHGCLAPIGEAVALPAAAFTDPDWFAAEQRTLFRRSWVAVARSENLAEPGSFATATVGAEPVVVTRDRNGELRALSNTCVHRGTVLCSGRGNAGSLSCPNHAWTYGLDGQLRAAPHMGEGFTVDDRRLPEYAVAEWNGWVLVNLDPDAPSPSAQLAGLDDILSAEQTTGLVSVGELHYPSPWNWKISVENFVESYHHRPAHPQTLDATYPGAQSFARFGDGAPWGGVDHVSVIDGADPFFAVAAYPTLLFAVLRGVGIVWFDLTPLAVDRSHLRIELLVRPELSDQMGGMEAALAAVNDEDIAINTATWAGMQSADYVPGPVSPLEGACWHFRQWLVRRVAAAHTAHT